jgi:hypothetical protein
VADPHDEVKEELKGAHQMFGAKVEELSPWASDKAKGTSSWTKEHARCLHEELDASLHKVKIKLSRSDNPVHVELEGKVDEARVDMEAQFATIEDGDHERTHSIVAFFHKRVDEWMEDISASGREW